MWPTCHLRRSRSGEVLVDALASARLSFGIKSIWRPITPGSALIKTGTANED